jgi:hypothetical protein
MVVIPPEKDLKTILERLLDELSRENTHLPLTSDKITLIVHGKSTQH